MPTPALIEVLIGSTSAVARATSWPGAGPGRGPATRRAGGRRGPRGCASPRSPRTARADTVAPPVATAVSSPAPATPSATRIRCSVDPRWSSLTALPISHGAATKPQARAGEHHAERCRRRRSARCATARRRTSKRRALRCQRGPNPHTRGAGRDPYGTPHRRQAIAIALQAVDGAGVVAQDHPRGALDGRRRGAVRAGTAASASRHQVAPRRYSSGVRAASDAYRSFETGASSSASASAVGRPRHEAGSSARGRTRRCRTHAPASPPRARTGSSGAARRSWCGSAR